MCRIIGAVGRELDSSFLSDVFLELENLGKDATGFWFPNTNIVKEPKKVTEFLPEKKEIFEEGANNSHVFIGHTRIATHGRPEFNYNNHPIESKNWILVHNGVVSMKDIKDYPYTTDTDTENILAHIEHFGIEKGLEYCTSGASIILVNKAEEDTLYFWRTYHGDMALAYDAERESVYICSGSKYFWQAMKPKMKNIERFNGLFATIDKRLFLSEVEHRELWKATYKNNEVSAEKVATIGSNYSATTYTGGGHWNTRFDKKDEDDLFLPLGYGKNRPAVKEGRLVLDKPKYIGAREYNTNTQHTTNSVTKPKQQLAEVTPAQVLYPGDIVKFKRKLKPTDLVTSVEATEIMKIDTHMLFTIKSQLQDFRVVLERDDGIVFVSPKHLLNIVEPPNCLGLLYNAKDDACCMCLHEEMCLDFLGDYKDLPQPDCVGQFDADGRECISCVLVTACLAKASKQDYIDADYEEINETIVKEN